MNYDKILKAIEKNGGEVVISQALNLISCVNFKVKSGNQNVYKLKWEQPIISKTTRFLKNLFKMEINEKPYLTWNGVKPIFAYSTFESVDEFLEYYSPRYCVDENLNVHLRPHIAIEHSNDTTNLFFDTIEEANEVYRLMLDAFNDVNLPIIVNEKFEEKDKRIKVLPDKIEDNNKKIKEDGSIQEKTD